MAPAAAVALRHPSPLATAAAAGLPYTALVSSPSQAALKYAPTVTMVTTSRRMSIYTVPSFVSGVSGVFASILYIVFNFKIIIM